MKSISIVINPFIPALILFVVAANRLSAQTDFETNAEAVKFSHEIQLEIKEFETGASEIETNQSLLDSQKAIDHEMARVEKSLRAAIVGLEFSHLNMDRKERTILWFDILASIDRHLGKIPGVDISGHIRPPPGYKGRLGIDGMEMPDTNDVTDYNYYMAARRANRRNAMNAGFQYMLHGENDDEATPYARKYFRSCYTSEADKREFEDMLDHSKLSDARKKALKEAIVGSGR